MRSESFQNYLCILFQNQISKHLITHEIQITSYLPFFPSFYFLSFFFLNFFLSSFLSFFSFSLFSFPPLFISLFLFYLCLPFLDPHNFYFFLCLLSCFLNSHGIKISINLNFNNIFKYIEYFTIFTIPSPSLNTVQKDKGTLKWKGREKYLQIEILKGFHYVL